MRVKDFLDLFVNIKQNVLIIVDGKIEYSGDADVVFMEEEIEASGCVDYLNLWLRKVGTDEVDTDYLVIVAEY